MNGPVDYLELLRQLHQGRKPSRYLEIGVWAGDSLRCALPDTEVVAVDPSEPCEYARTRPHTVAFHGTSDAFFDWYASDQFDMIFVDGLHEFGQVARDFGNSISVLHPFGLLAIHDVFPTEERHATPEPTDSIWTGDVWRLLPLLEFLRKQAGADILYTQVPPTGMAILRGVTPLMVKRLTEMADVIMFATEALEWPDYVRLRATLPMVTLEEVANHLC